ncbi:MAG TPA: TonB-dependent receptor [Longimicrobiales bacterium]
MIRSENTRFVNAAAIAAALAVLTMPSAGSAQTVRDTLAIDSLVVTATKLPVPAAATGAAITVLNGDDLRAQGVRRVVDALRRVPGVAIAQLGGTGAVASVFMRGGESDHVQVLIDGVQVNDPGGSYDWAHLTTDDVERIEVVRGPVSVLYGSDAVAGVVQIFTRAGLASGHSLRAQLMGGRGERVGPESNGSYDAVDWNTSVGGGAAIGATALRYAATASNVRSDGAYAYNNEYDNRTFSGRLSLERAGLRGGVTARYVDQVFHYPTSGSGTLADHNQLTDGTALTLGATAGWFFTPTLELRGQVAAHRSETGGSNPPDADGDGFSNSTADVRRNSAELALNAHLARGIIATMGAEAEQQKGSTTFDSDGPFGPFSTASESQRNNVGYYAQLLASPVDRVDLSGGVRVDDNEQFGTFTTGRASAAVQVLPALRVRGAVGSGFREPTFLEAYATGFAVGDPDLRPERSASIEGGAELRIGRAVVGATYFSQRFRDLIQYTFTAEPGTPNYFNIGRAEASGVEVTGARDAGPVDLSAHYTYVHTRVIDQGFGEDRAFLEGMRLLRRPTHQASLTGAFSPARSLDMSTSVIYTGDRDDLDFTDPADFAGRRTKLPSHVTVDASASYRIPMRGAAVALLMRGTNLFDRRFDEVYNFPAAGRLLWIGASVELGRAGSAR